MGFFGDLVGAIPVVGDIAQVGVNLVSGAISGDGDAPKPTPYLGVTVPGQTPDAVVVAVLARMTPTERAELERLWAAANVGRMFPAANPWELAHSIAGGNDGRVGSAAGRELQAYWNQLVSRYGGGVGTMPTTLPAPSTQPSAPILNGGWSSTGGGHVSVTTAGGDGGGFPWAWLALGGAAVGLAFFATR